ncbi:hypothetical protein Aab01nite_01780 [Paractinoplanes abujensis]|uniref:Heme/copper-type cytochrome/quinol oxidase subunit 1 n=1 Tax=Paractinoplanes abujensis TaxID=882441 RepID=A0A7W7CNV5_9ACTN|nr:heme/copper-type cytochrome/quinol oxidase subunit 1 [Actinoplanes abujensis]GID16588.1 hypothetical protein Aab01nite_01780 [Actinoplanes abujensis]
MWSCDERRSVTVVSGQGGHPSRSWRRPRRYADYLPGDGFTTLNTVSTIGSFVLAATLPFLYNVWYSYRAGPLVTAQDPWGHGTPWNGRRRPNPRTR